MDIKGWEGGKRDGGRRDVGSLKRGCVKGLAKQGGGTRTRFRACAGVRHD